MRSKHKSKYKGVVWIPVSRKWRATVTKDKVYHDCGMYTTEVEAAKARDRRIMALGLDVKLQVYRKLEKLEIV